MAWYGNEFRDRQPNSNPTQHNRHPQVRLRTAVEREMSMAYSPVDAAIAATEQITFATCSRVCEVLAQASTSPEEVKALRRAAKTIRLLAKKCEELRKISA